MGLLRRRATCMRGPLLLIAERDFQARRRALAVRGAAGGAGTSGPCPTPSAGTRRPRGATRATSGGRARPRRGAPAPASSVGAAAPSRTRTTAAACSPEPVVGRGHHADLGHRVDAEQQLLDLLGADVLAAPDDDVGDAVGDGEVAVVVEHADVAGAVPAVVVEGRGGQLGVGVAEAAVRAPAEDLAVVVEPELDARAGRGRRW